MQIFPPVFYLYYCCAKCKFLGTAFSADFAYVMQINMDN